MHCSHFAEEETGKLNSIQQAFPSSVLGPEVQTKGMLLFIDPQGAGWETKTQATAGSQGKGQEDSSWEP